MSDPSILSDWDRVDDAADGDAFRDYLDTVTGLDRIERAKRRSHRLLAPTEGDTLLDVGCGTGEDALALGRAVGPDGSVVGVDNSETMVAEARTRASASDPVSFGTADAERLPFADDAVDGCRADRVLQHLERPFEALAEARRVTRPGGRVAVTDPDWGTLVVDAPGAEADLGARILDPAWSCARNGRVGRRLRRWAREAGLTDFDVDAATLALTDFEAADEVFGLTGRVEGMRRAGALTEREATRWLEAVRSADRDGSFFGSLGLFTVAGTVPGASDRDADAALHADADGESVG